MWFDFQITTYKMILILNNIYLGDLILKSSTYDDFAHLWLSLVSIVTKWYGSVLQTQPHLSTDSCPLSEAAEAPMLHEAGWRWIATSSSTRCPSEAHVAVAQTGGEALDACVSPLV